MILIGKIKKRFNYKKAKELQIMHINNLLLFISCLIFIEIPNNHFISFKGRITLYLKLLKCIINGTPYAYLWFHDYLCRSYDKGNKLICRLIILHFFKIVN